MVTAIISILAAMLLPALSRAKAAAETTVCRNNLRQIGLGIHLYVSDFSAYMDPFWPEKLKPYVKASLPGYNGIGSGQFLPGTGLFACPGYNRMPGVYGSLPGDESVWVAYAYNVLGMGFDPNLGPGGTHMGLSGAREARVLKPVEMILFGDSVLYPPAYAGFTPLLNLGTYDLSEGIYDHALRASNQSGTQDDNRRRTVYQQRHSSRFNIIFCDGHLEYQKAGSFFNVRQDIPVARFWNCDNQPHLNLYAPVYEF